jgi:coproporphyrinogen III oxidase
MTYSIHNGFINKLQLLQKNAQKNIAQHYHDILEIHSWTSSIGYGLTGVCEGRFLEKAAISISVVSSESLPEAATLMRPHLIGRPYEVAGLSVVMHPLNPHLPSAHANIRCFEVITDKNTVLRWYGGGVDLTPYIPADQDSLDWHQALQLYIKKYDPSLKLYDDWKNNCDRYFYLKHRKEPRGIGGVFFDDYEGLGDMESTESFLVGLIELFFEWNFYLADKYLQKNYSQHEKDFQCWRRGRYVEFNLLHDRGTLFGLQAGGRVEAILLSLPPNVKWIYNGDIVFKENNDLLLNHLDRHSCFQKYFENL